MAESRKQYTVLQTNIVDGYGSASLLNGSILTSKSIKPEVAVIPIELVYTHARNLCIIIMVYTSKMP